MTTLTNTHGLPQVIVDALLNDDYDRGESDITVTELVSPPRMVALKLAHAHEIRRDASEMLFLLQGKLMHKLLEEAGRDALTEERLYTERLGWKIGGKFDHVTVENIEKDTYKLTDWKNSSVWAWKDGVKPEYVAQANLYALLLREHGFNVTTLACGVLYRDWSKPAARRGDHPKVGAQEFKVPLWHPIDQEYYLNQAVEAHQAARRELPECTDEDRWAKAPKYAVMKEGREKALRLLDTKGEALEWIGQQHNLAAGTVRIVYRPGENTRCQDYCEVAPFCSQWQAMQA